MSVLLFEDNGEKFQMANFNSKGKHLFVLRMRCMLFAFFPPLIPTILLEETFAKYYKVFQSKNNKHNRFTDMERNH